MSEKMNTLQVKKFNHDYPITLTYDQCKSGESQYGPWYLYGVSAFKELLKVEATKNIPVLFMTAYPTSQIKEQVMVIGAKGCISKPFISEDFEQTIDQVLNKYDLIEHQEINPTYAQLN